MLVQWGRVSTGDLRNSSLRDLHLDKDPVNKREKKTEFQNEDGVELVFVPYCLEMICHSSAFSFE